MGRYAMAYTETDGFPQTITQTPTQLGYISAYTKMRGADANVGENSLRINIAGIYRILAVVALTSDVADNFYISVYRNGLFTGIRNVSSIDTTDIRQIVVHDILDLDVNDVIELYIHSASDASYAVTVRASQFSVVAI